MNTLILPRGSSSDPLIPLVFLGIALTVVAGVVLANRIITNRRRKAYEGFCFERGYRFEPERPGEEARHVATCPVFSEGHGHTWGFTIAGTSGGTPFTAFEYKWTTGSGRNSQAHRIGGLLWTMERPLPQFLLTPEGLWARLAPSPATSLASQKLVAKDVHRGVPQGAKPGRSRRQAGPVSGSPAWAGDESAEGGAPGGTPWCTPD